MPCLFVAGALILPRVTIAYLWLMTNWFAGIFGTLLWPILGFIFAPTTLLWYTVVENLYAGQWGIFQYVVLGIAIMIDASPSSGKKKKKSD